jgi:hypothetical protein
MFEELDLWIGEILATKLVATSTTKACTIGASQDTCNPATDTCGGSYEGVTCSTVQNCSLDSCPQ